MHLINEITIALLIVCCILIFVAYTNVGKNLAEKCNSTSGLITDSVKDFFVGDPEKMYQETRGDFYNIKAKMTLKKSLTIPEEKRQAKDNLRIGNIYRHFVKNPIMAREYYRKAAEQIKQKPAEANRQMIDQMEALNREDVLLRIDIPHIREIVAEDRMMHEIRRLGDVVVERPVHFQQATAPVNGPRPFGFTPKPVNLTVKIMGEENKDKYLKGLQEWTADAQNVHDSNITDDVAKSYQALIQGLPSQGYDPNAFKDMKDEIRQLHKAGHIEQDVSYNAITTIDAMNNDLIYSKIGLPEQTILTNIWRRINIPANKERRHELMVSFAENLATAVEKTNVDRRPVCTGGRIARTMRTFAHIDHNPNIGILRSKEAVRNEVFQTAHHEYKSFSDAMMAESNTDPLLKKGANDSKLGEDTAESQAFDNAVKQKITERLQKDYSKLIEAGDLDLLIKESHAAF
jgi:predicted metal-dependent hydrolase